MRRTIVAWALVLSTTGTGWAEWEFEDRAAVSPDHGAKIYHHLDSAGRKNIAAKGDTVAVTWEDNHTGTPQVYVALKSKGAGTFGSPVQLSDGREAYSPVIVATGGDAFLVGWEQDSQIRVCRVGDEGVSRPLTLSARPGRQVALVELAEGDVLAAWASKVDDHWQVVAAKIGLDDTGKPETAGTAIPTDGVTPTADQIFPTLASWSGGISVIWEDRRHGHTVLLYSQSRDGKSFRNPEKLNEVVQKSSKYGRGSGVTRAAAASYGDGGAAVAWMDKRGFRTGYDIYAALGDSRGERFGKNIQVQDSFGDNISQWNPAIAGNGRGDLAVTWDDDRDLTSDIFLTWKTEEGWSDDVAVEPASGDGQQSSSAIAIDDDRDLHVVWIDQEKEFGPTRLFYALGRFVGE